MVTRFDGGHTFSDRFHNAASFVTQDTREKSLRIVSIQRVDIRVA